MNRDRHPRGLASFNKDTNSVEPVMVNRHSYAERWEWDPDWTPEKEAEYQQQRGERICEQSQEASEIQEQRQSGEDKG